MKGKMLQLAKIYWLPILIVLSTIDELVREKEMEDRMDDMVYFGIGILALVVSIFVKGKMQKYFSLFIFVAAVLTKIIAIFIEHDDFKAVDHDYVILGFMALSVILPLIFKRKPKEA